MSRHTLVGLALAAALTVTVAVPATAEEVSAPFPSARFPLGERGMPAKTHKSVGGGIDLYSVSTGTANDGYTVTVLMPSGRDYGRRETAEAKAAEVEAAGQTASVQRVVRPAVSDDPSEEIFMVRVGLWPLKDKDKAVKAAKELSDAGVKARADYLGDDGVKTTGPWQMQVLTVDPRAFRGSFAASLGTSVAKRETTSSMANARKAIAAINGGFFNIHTQPALRGEPVGISVVGGRLLSEAVPGRSAVVLKGRTARITELTTKLAAISQDGTRLDINGVNRLGATDELILYTEEYGAKTPANGGAEAILDASGKVISLRTAGGAVPKGARILHGSGAAADWLWEHAWENWSVTVDTKVIDQRTGRRVALTPDVSVIGGGVGLIRNGRIKVTAKRDGHDSVNMILRRHPRTLMGVTRSGGLVLATVDGRKPGITVGANMIEAAQLMKWLGAVQAINLDGGGSTAMVVGGKVVNQPSDGRERAVGDALLVLP
ncbi:phosphodiester glycosidase family protein [Nonomuraea africana]|uniref:Exopolysaccharide biosynthesis protein n=1 Tax=Nonomuraea africana TaxID=46171 RepID=A0ABR9K5D0_9ACTN|nr:phosphodiester glycosidase family protein [Nonomuraea africana]MBE1557224.1 exopolysaccharide biosynthesis protein [Nonomuraea africana]